MLGDWDGVCSFLKSLWISCILAFEASSFLQIKQIRASGFRLLIFCACVSVCMPLTEPEQAVVGQVWLG